MAGRYSRGAPAPEPTIYCVVPRRLAHLIYDDLRDHFRGDPDVEIVIEQRRADRRTDPDRRADYQQGAETAENRRRIHSATGRRIADRRGRVKPADIPGLPPEAEPYATELVFIERRPRSPEEDEDADTARIVTRIQAGDRDAFSDIYLRYFDRVYSYMRIALRHDEEAEDATQDVFARVLNAVPRYERQRVPFRAWLFRIVRNMALDRLRTQHRLELADPIEFVEGRHASAGVELPALEWISDRDLVGLIERLPMAQRQVLVLRYMLDLGITEIAQVMELEPNHVSVLNYRALGFLRARLAAKEDNGEPGSRRSQMRRRHVPSPVLAARSRALAY